VGVVFATWFVSDQINRRVQRQTRALEEQIAAGQFDAKRVEMERMETIQENFESYKNRVRLAKAMFDFLPRGDLPQIMDQLHNGLRLVADDPEMTGVFFAFHDVKWNRYGVSLIVFGEGREFPSNYVDALNRIGFFDGVRYDGYRLVERSTLPPAIMEQVPSNVTHPIRFELSVQLKGGHIFEADGSKYGFCPRCDNVYNRCNCN
jgi:hypothetical protein